MEGKNAPGRAEPAAPKLVAIDAMPLLYRGHFALAKRPRLTSAGFNASALFVYANIVRDMAENRGATHVALAMDGSATFRHERYPEYKARREKLPEDIAASIGPAEQLAAALRIPFLRVPGFEADDVLGSLAALATAAGVETWIVSPDKDMAQLVCPGVKLCRPSHAPGDPDEIYDEERVCAEWGLSSPAQMVDYLGMAGDAADNIPGLPGVGPKTARELLARFGSLEGAIARASEIKGKLAEKVAAGAETARLSRWLAEIRRDAPLPCTMDDLRRREPDLPALEAFCRKYELFGLMRRYGITAGGEGESGGRPAEKAAAKGAAAAGEGSANAEEAQAEPLATAATTPHTYRTALSDQDLDELAAELAAAPEFAFDTETTGLDPRNARVVGLSFSTAPGTAWYVPVAAGDGDAPAAQGQSGAGIEPEAPAAPEQGDLFDFFAAAEPAAEYKAETAATGGDGGGDGGAGGEGAGFTAERIAAALGPAFADTGKVKRGHNAKFDIHALRTLGIEVAPPVPDSMLAHYVVDPARRHGMDPLAREFLHYDPIPIERLIGEKGKAQKSMAEVPLAEIAEYAAEDADVTLRLHRALEPEVRRAGAWRAYSEAENPLVPILADMEEAGIRLDVPALQRYGAELGREISAKLSRIQELAGVAFNVDSPQQLGKVLFGTFGLPCGAKTSTGQPSTSEEVLQGLAGMHPAVQLVLDYRALSKLKSTYADRLPERIDPRDGRVHTTFQQANAETGRLSSDNPNLQNIPVRTERGKPIRAAFLAADDRHKLVSADYSQIELRVMAALSGDEGLLEAFRDDQDIHAATAARVYGIPVSEVTREQRSHCKQVSFGIVYGISPFGLAQRLGIDRHRAEGLIESYFSMFPGVKDYMEKTVADARRDGFVTTLLGRRRPLRDITSRNATVRAAAERVAVNTPVQGTAADLVKLAMVRVSAALEERRLASRLVLQVHDELVLDCPDEEVAEVSAVVRAEMENALPLPVPLKVDVGSGANWLEAH
ncbi:MAG: DNA polymerase I [Kiritimatiellae bacterium]|nr:DNA polymerase I [Kiritimatiellia bacterium]